MINSLFGISADCGNWRHLSAYWTNPFPLFESSRYPGNFFFNLMINFELVVCVLGIYLCFLSWGVLQERVSTTPYYEPDDLPKSGPPAFFKHFVYLNFIQSICASLVAYFYRCLAPKSTDFKKNVFGSKHLLFDYAKVALYSTCASPFGYAALKHVDYPTMILAKSCKLIPVMIMSFLLHRRTFQAFKYFSVAMITAGVSLFMLFHSDGKASGASSSLWGLFLLSINLAIDGATNSTQDHIFNKHSISGAEMMFFMNLFSALLMLIYLAAITPFLNPGYSSEMLDAIYFSLRFPQSSIDILLFGLLGAIGQLFIFYTLKRFGSLILVTVNVTRKMFSILLSIFWFNHQMSTSQWFAVFLVFGGIGLDAFLSARLKQKSSLKKTD